MAASSEAATTPPSTPPITAPTCADACLGLEALALLPLPLMGLIIIAMLSVAALGPGGDRLVDGAIFDMFKVTIDTCEEALSDPVYQGLSDGHLLWHN